MPGRVPNLNTPGTTRILVVSADATNAKAAAAHLAAMGYTQVVHMDNGVDAIRSVTETAMDLVVVDNQVQHLTGWTLVKELKTSEKIANMPLILLGKSEAPAPKDELQRFGIVDYFRMPGTTNAFQFLVQSTVSVFRTSGTIENNYSKAKKALINEQTQIAVELYSELRGRTAKDLRSSVGLAQAYLQGEQIENAAGVLAEVSHDSGGNSFALLLNLRLQLGQEKAKEALATAESLLSLTPESPYYFSRCLRIAHEFDALDLVEHICRAGVALGFPLPEFSLSLAKCKFVRQEYESAAKLVDSTVQKYGPSTDSLNLKGACLRKMNLLDKAIECYEEALRISPMDHKVYFNLAICANSLAKKGLAIEYLAACLRISPSFKRAEDLLAELSGQKGSA